jgi:hypothetical protein
METKTKSPAQQYCLFYNGGFSNWHKSKFTVDGVEYNCGEQYMMHCKAIFFNDFETAQKIMATEKPSEQKALGREIKNFNSAGWDKVKYDLVKTGLREKFLQNENLKDLLMKYRGCIFVEASPYDRIWGIGYDEVEAMENMENWGLNLLGKILTELSNELVQ